MDSDEIYWLWLQYVLGYADTRIKNVLEEYGSAKEFFKAPADIAKKCGLKSSQVKRLNSEKPERFSDISDYCRAHGIKIINIGNKLYPKRLESISDPPTVIFVKGELPELDNEPTVTVVGPRRPSEYGIKSAFSLSRRLSLGGFIVISGGAKGVDSYAHAGALSVGAKTVAVLGCGIDADYLKCNRELREKISENGCLISEFPPNVGASRSTFPIRNRIMSALSLGTIVVEAGKKSGALITAAHAAEQGRDVFAIPGNPSDPNYFGSNALIRDGARPLLTALDVFDEYISLYPDKIDIERAFDPKGNTGATAAFEEAVKRFSGASAKSAPKPEKSQSVPRKTPEKPQKEPSKIPTVDSTPKKDKNTDMLSDDAKRFYEGITESPFFIDDIIAKTGLTSFNAISAATELEVLGMIKSVPGGRFETV